MSTLSRPDLVNVKIHNVKCVVDEKEIKVTATIPTLQRLLSEKAFHSHQAQNIRQEYNSNQCGCDRKERLLLPNAVCTFLLPCETRILLHCYRKIQTLPSRFYMLNIV